MAVVETEPYRTLRQRDLIAVATRLFAQKGYHAVGINEISGELGLTGPAFYRHYPSKEALLIAVLDDAISSHLQEVGDLVASVSDPLETLEAIIDNHIRFVFDQTENIVTWRTEFRNLPDNDRHRLRYLQRLYTEEWVRTVRRLRPELDAETARARCHAVIALLQSPTEYSSRLSREQLAPMLREMALLGLLAEGTREASRPARARGAAARPTPRRSAG